MVIRIEGLTHGTKRHTTLVSFEINYFDGRFESPLVCCTKTVLLFQVPFNFKLGCSSLKWTRVQTQLMLPNLGVLVSQYKVDPDLDSVDAGLGSILN